MPETRLGSLRCWPEALKRVRFASGNAWAPRAFGRAQDRSPTQYASTRGRKTCASHECTLQEGLRAYVMTLTTACITITSVQTGLRRLWSQLDRRQVLWGRDVTVCQQFQSSTELTLRCLLPILPLLAISIPLRRRLLSRVYVGLYCARWRRSSLHT